MKWVLLIVACAVLVVAAAAVATQYRWAGELSPYGNATVGVPVRVGSPFTVGMGELHTKRPIRIESVRLEGPTGGIELVGSLVHSSGQGIVGSERRFPPTFPSVPMRAAEGAVVPADTPTVLVVGLRATRPGQFRVHGVEVRYRERRFGIDVRRRAHVGVEVTGCAVRKAAGVPRCTLPRPSD